MGKDVFNGSRLMLDKIKDQARETGELVTVLIDARKVLAKLSVVAAPSMLFHVASVVELWKE